ncbi:2-amino-4-hydroxy-6-hydroxymethyldihydropteridine diphosphokinase [Geofilum rhodophaeum]|uniref:2-amino-4-hydroxy-6- hydroxymethyldihydropteridine diphosphokinase n=1 Tax=Geofilum rhodophaeum TaxID=1965019 RepID=UPI000B5260B2|nr:2-amino-4-hydroxy-6-hydroxymethyldihydropteridine diphosphokinase [Geofilum rhodophaeum]
MSEIVSAQRFLLLLGGNEAETGRLMDAALERLCKAGLRVLLSSSDYESEAWGFTAERPFLNRVVEIETVLAAEDLLTLVLEVESALGRRRQAGGGYASRGIDIDLLWSGTRVIQTERLTLPHPRLHLRRFTLLPLCEHWSHCQHPILHRSMGQLLESCVDQGAVRRLP